MTQGTYILSGNFLRPKKHQLDRVVSEGVNVLFVPKSRQVDMASLERTLGMEPLFPTGFGQTDWEHYGNDLKGYDRPAVHNAWRRLGDLLVHNLDPTEKANLPLRTQKPLRGRIPERPYEDLQYNFDSLRGTLDELDQRGISRQRAIAVGGFGLSSCNIWQGFVHHHVEAHLHQIVDRLLNVQ